MRDEVIKFVTDEKRKIKFHTNKEYEIKLEKALRCALTSCAFKDTLENIEWIEQQYIRLEKVEQEWQKSLIYYGRKFDQRLKNKHFSNEEELFAREEVKKYYETYVNRKKEVFKIFFEYFRY